MIVLEKELLRNYRGLTPMKIKFKKEKPEIELTTESSQTISAIVEASDALRMIE